MSGDISGVRSLRVVKETGPHTVGQEILEKYKPKQLLRIVSPMSKLPYERKADIESLLSVGVNIELLLIDPRVEPSLYGMSGQEERGSPVSMLNLMQIIANLNKVNNSYVNLAIRYYDHYFPEVLFFIDEERLFLYSSFPYISPSRHVYEIIPGEASLYSLYNEAFQFLWARSKSWINPTVN